MSGYLGDMQRQDGNMTKGMMKLRYKQNNMVTRIRNNDQSNIFKFDTTAIYE